MEFEPSRTLPTPCPICEDERQYIPGGTQRWTCSETLEREATRSRCGSWRRV